MPNLTALIWVTAALASTGSDAPPALDGEHGTFTDELLDKLVGDWRLKGTVLGKPADNDVSATWELKHQFMQVRFKAVAGATEPYEALVFIGYGTRKDGRTIAFVFEYPDGPFHNTFSFDASSERWTFLLEQKSSAGKWTTFATQTLTRAVPKAARSAPQTP